MYRRRGAAFCFVTAVWLSVGCSNQDAPTTTPGPAKAVEAAEGLTKSDNGWVFHTSSFTLEPAQERFLCYSVTTDEDLAIGRFISDARPYIHHFLFATAVLPEPEGMSECDVLFKPTWSPMYIATTASADVSMPAGAAKLIDKQTQLVLQLHLLNSTSKPVTGVAEIKMERSHEVNPEPVGIFAFGTTNIHLPPNQTSQAQGKCTVPADAKLFSMMPHMHYLGTRLELELGPDDDHLESVFVSDPYDFDYQKIEPFDRTITAGTHSRITCTYNNTKDKMISFGESSLTEMCFGIGFAVGEKGPRGCLAKVEVPDGGVPRDPNAGVCGESEAAGGIGRKCTTGGGDCEQGDFCTADRLGGSDAGVATGSCIKLGCSTSADCGSGATCCSPAQGGGLIKICTSEACRDPSCIPAP